MSACPASQKLKKDWAEEGREFEERAVDKNQVWLDEALKLSDMTPVIVDEDGKIQIGYQGMIG